MMTLIGKINEKSMSPSGLTKNLFMTVELREKMLMGKWIDMSNDKSHFKENK